jgi:uncharacterized coiled-coil DUF342 family protein
MKQITLYRQKLATAVERAEHFRKVAERIKDDLDQRAQNGNLPSELRQTWNELRSAGQQAEPELSEEDRGRFKRARHRMLRGASFNERQGACQQT